MQSGERTMKEAFWPKGAALQPKRTSQTRTFSRTSKLLIARELADQDDWITWWRKAG